VDCLRPRLELVAQAHVDALFADASDQVPDPVVAVVAAAQAPAEPESRSSLPAKVVDFPLPPTVDQPQDAPAGPALPPAATPAPARWDLLEQCRLDPQRPASGSYQRLVDRLVSTTDPEAAPMRSGGRARLGDHAHDVVDGGKHRSLLQALVTPADVMEHQPMLDLRWRARFRWHLHPKRAVGDTTSGTIEHLRALEDAGIRA
jgi:hypothetical protein